jgi:hypothetical protein
VRRKTVEAEKTELLSRVAEEKRARQDIEGQKKKIEQELENLTAALFEEANKMVISAKEEARKEHDVLHRKNEQLKAQLADTEGLLRSQQEQLSELKGVMEQMAARRSEDTAPTVPSSPRSSRSDARDDLAPPDGVSQCGLMEPPSPSYPTKFSHLLQPVLRTDLPPYGDFKALIRTSKRLSDSRITPGPTSSLAALGIGLGSAASNGSTSSLSTAGTPLSGSFPQSPNTPSSATSPASSTSAGPLPPLKDTKFYKRVLAEDIEPTLRLDIAPGLSWLARRNVISAMTDGSLVVEPMPNTGVGAARSKPQLYPCALCGESRGDEEHLRTHRFRTSESDSAQRYTLCRYCLARVRSTCDFLGFLRIVKGGHWRSDDQDAEKAAWEESVRLREQMFWSRIGGGVLPVGHVQPNPSTRVAGIEGNESHDFGQKKGEIDKVEEMPAQNSAEKPAESSSELSVEKLNGQGHDRGHVYDSTGEAIASEGAEQGSTSDQESTSCHGNSSHPLHPGPEKGVVKRLSLTIPGTHD